MNRTTLLSCTSSEIEVQLLEDAKDFFVQGRCIVVNTGMQAAVVDGDPPKSLPTFHSTVLVDTVIRQAESIILLRVHDGATARNLTQEPRWAKLGDILAEATGNPAAFPTSIPLWRGPQSPAGYVHMDAAAILSDEEAPSKDLEKFRVQVNLWYAPAGTDCAIHNDHNFIEVHTQVLGYGRMQKFHKRDHASLYEDLYMAPGYTTPQPFCSLQPDGSFRYPWHQYFADTDSVWLAVEYHRETN
ncbi:hypothetical protein AB0I82_11230 [Streptomyces sp. NPDC050315]|uniref:hypothetical protein n=1 Tax=Streptomyces sp. NPDC050315 TaxID=3155039 RepID=UPI0034427ED6